MNKKKININKALLPLMKKHCSKILAEDILGVQPMTGPIGQVFKMKAIWRIYYGEYITRRAWGLKTYNGKRYFLKKVTGIVFSHLPDDIEEENTYKTRRTLLEGIDRPYTASSSVLVYFTDTDLMNLKLSGWFDVMEEEGIDFIF